MGHPNEDRLRAGYEAFQAGDVDGLRTEYFTEDSLWHAPGNSPVSGDYKGIDQILAHFLDLIQRTDGTLAVSVHDVLGNDEHAVVLGHVRGEREGKAPIDQNFVHVAHIKDGKVSESWIHNTDQAADDAFWND